MAQPCNTVEVWRIPPGTLSEPYPWRYAIIFYGKRIVFGGAPNHMATRIQALSKARRRLNRWLRNRER